MNILNLTIEANDKKLYLIIANAIRTSIKNGQVTPSEKLPSARNLAKQLQVNRHTIMAAYNELIAQGWVETKQRRGYMVSKTLPIYHSKKLNESPIKTIKSHQWRIVKEDNTEPQKPANQYLFNFAGGNPDISIFPFSDFRSYMNTALNRPAIKDLNYGDNAGFPPFIKEVSTYLRRVRSINNKEIIVVNGTQEALYILSQVLLKKGDKVAVESLGYRPAWKAFENTGAELIGIKQTEQGIDVEHLALMFKQHKIQLLYLTPLHQYPTTTTLPVGQRIKIYRLAQQYNIPIIEDDYDHEFHYDTQPLAPMAANDPSGLIIYLSSFSKLMFPAVRLGIIAVDKSLTPHLINYRTLINHKANVILQDAVAKWMKDGAFERQLRKATRLYQKRRQCMVNMLNNFKREGIDINFTIPPGGMALWVNVGSNAKQISIRAKDRGIFLLAENAFHLNHQNNQDKYIRLGFSGQDEEKIEQGLLSLKSLLNANTNE
jgi:GntR family transcriptional regulator / MocR family aminotransferase